MIKEAERAGTLPPEMQNPPELWFGNGLYWKAFCDLSPSRPAAFGFAPIPWATVQFYADHLELTETEAQAMHYFIGEMDKIWLDHHSKKDS